MISNNIVPIIGFLAALAAGLATTAAAPKEAEPGIQLTEAGRQLETKHAATFTALQAEITKAWPSVAEQKKAVLQSAREAVKQAKAEANAAQQSLNKIQEAKGLPTCNMLSRGRRKLWAAVVAPRRSIFAS